MGNFLFKKAANLPITSNLRIYTAHIFKKIHVIFMLCDLWVSLHEMQIKRENNKYIHCLLSLQFNIPNHSEATCSTSAYQVKMECFV